jgi:hypothetical protein
MAGRLIFGHLPDRIGGTKVALVCVLIEAAGQALIWLARLKLQLAFSQLVEVESGNLHHRGAERSSALTAHPARSKWRTNSASRQSIT